MLRVSLSAAAATAILAALPVTGTVAAFASMHSGAERNASPTEPVIPTGQPVDPQPEPEPTTMPEPTAVPEPTAEPEPQPTEAPVPEPVPVEPVAPVEEPSYGGDDTFFDDSDGGVDEAPVVPVETPVVTPTPTPTPSATPIPAIDIFAPFYPASSGTARDLAPLILGGAAAALMMLAAITSFAVSRFRLARLRSLAAVSLNPQGESPSMAERVSTPMPHNLDISSLVGASAEAAPKVDMAGLPEWNSGLRAIVEVTGSASMDLRLPTRSIARTDRSRVELDLPVFQGRRAGATSSRPAGSRAGFSLVGVFTRRAAKKKESRFHVDVFESSAASAKRTEAGPRLEFVLPPRSASAPPL